MLPEQVVGMARNKWSASIGIDGRHGPDYATLQNERAKTIMMIRTNTMARVLGGLIFVLVLPHCGHLGERSFPRGYQVYLQSSQTFRRLLVIDRTYGKSSHAIPLRSRSSL
jgi:hypothetical protein